MSSIFSKYFLVDNKDFLGYYFYMAKKRGRPKKLAKERLQASLKIRLTKQELKAIKESASQSELDASKWARNILLKHAEHVTRE